MEKRITYLEDIEAIRQLKYEYCAACDDKHNADRMVAIFTEDGVWDGSQFGRAEGHKEIWNLFHNGHANNILISQHNVMNSVITVDGDKAHGRWYGVIPLTTKEAGRIWCFARYEEDYVKIDGKWYIKYLQACDDGFVAPFETGWYGAQYVPRQQNKFTHHQ